ncbi:MAG TPA: hypothetical protein VGF20_02385 [Candidatus Acidoferrum sp.]
MSTSQQLRLVGRSECSRPGIARSEPAAAARSDSIALWMWWNLLSLDAPSVAVLWAVLFARASGTHLPFAESMALGFSVWTVYVCDRLLDSWRISDSPVLQARHRFCHQHTSSFVAALLLAAGYLAWIVSQLPRQEVTNGVKVAAVIAAYLLCVHAKAGRLARYVPKEIFVGIVFAVGTTLSVWSQARHYSWFFLVQSSLFAILCTLNCASIEYWETESVRSSWWSSPNLLMRLAGSRLNSLYLGAAGSALLAAMFFYTLLQSPSVLLAVAAGALSLLLINCKSADLSKDALRVLADAALVVPAILALAVRT